MQRTVFLVRHCKAEGQAPDAPLTDEGKEQAESLTAALSAVAIERIVSSPYVRARQTITPFAERLAIPIETDERLVEAGLSTIDYPDWIERLRATFADFDLSYEGGESSRAATLRATAAINDILGTNTHITLVVTHGRLLTLILRSFDSRFGFDEWQALTAPDLFHLTISDGGAQVDRIWNG
jgi:2,3-bisphosphoglycerate-dependent phosphoglycerate mutase